LLFSPQTALPASAKTTVLCPCFDILHQDIQIHTSKQHHNISVKKIVERVILFVKMLAKPSVWSLRNKERKE